MLPLNNIKEASLVWQLCTENKYCISRKCVWHQRYEVYDSLFPASCLKDLHHQDSWSKLHLKWKETERNCIYCAMLLLFSSSCLWYTCLETFIPSTVKANLLCLWRKAQVVDQQVFWFRRGFHVSLYSHYLL